jgi:CRP/FNR family transcriptional regulator, cyclic AMP receptor protein
MVQTAAIIPLLDDDIFDGLTGAALARLDACIPTVRYAKGELIHTPYDRSDALYVVGDGRVRLYRSAGDGRQLTLAILDDGMVFGRVPGIDDPGPGGYACALSDCALRVLRNGDLERTLAEHPRLAFNLLRALSSRLTSAEGQIESLAFRGVSARLAAKLLELMDRYGRVTPTGIRIDERFTHMQLAEMIGTSRETLTKVLNELRDQAFVDVRDRMIWVLDAPALERVAEAP